MLTVWRTLVLGATSYRYCCTHAGKGNEGQNLEIGSEKKWVSYSSLLCCRYRAKLHGPFSGPSHLQHHKYLGAITSICVEHHSFQAPFIALHIYEMTSASVHSSWYDTLSDSDISELAHAANGRAAISTDDGESSDGSDFGSESSYDPSVLTEDEEFIDDADASSSAASSDTYESDESGDSADDSDDTDDVEDFEACDRSIEDDDSADPAGIALLQTARALVEADCNGGSTVDERKPATFVTRTSQSSAFLCGFQDGMGYHTAKAVCLKRPTAFTCIDLRRGSYKPGAHGDRRQTQRSKTEGPSNKMH
jgi:hypothetical protein